MLKILLIFTSSPIKDIHLLFLDYCCRFYCTLELVHIDYKLIQSTHTDFTPGSGHGLLICRSHLLIQELFSAVDLFM